MKNYFFFCILLLSCTTSELLVSSSYQHWVGGRKETGSGTNYKFKLLAPEDHSKFIIQSVYAHNCVLNFNLYPSDFVKGDTLLIKAIKSDQYWPLDSSVAQINYILSDQTYSIYISEMIELEKLFYP